ncbi:MAG: Asp-tRNA(Asn)/Glu-tRNA(Gln) amidotransferase subunit GatA [Candidatus Latescibacterota bacterium]|nr:Asp-tRNA(Asn)/Glu-tRNA(Gln) amidotransferase subunit GatA [Candidatus Latescibacterota bacterium]
MVDGVLNERPAHELALAIKNGELRSRDLTDSVLDAIERQKERINAYITVDKEGARVQADEVDRRIASGEDLGPLAGIPVGLKDLICTKGLKTTCASHILDNFIPPYDATVVGKLRAADAVIVGKLNMDEFAMGSSNESSAYGPVRNPHDLNRVAGGSSGGSAAAIASGQAVLTLGSDTGGSIRQPASFCGVVGLKPTYGRVSRYGLVAYASSLDQIGPLGRNVRDTATLFQVISGHDNNDSTSADVAVPDILSELEDGVQGLRVGVPTEFFSEGLDDKVNLAVCQAIDHLSERGATIVNVSLPVAGHPQYAIAAYYIIATGEASSNLSRYDGVKYGHRAESDELIDMYNQTRSEGFGTEVKRRIMLGTYALSAGYYDAYYIKAQRVRTLIKQDFENVFGSCDIIASPVAPTTAFEIGEKVDNPLEMYLSDIYTVSVNLAGIPGISVPCGVTPDGLPIGLQLLAPPFEESRLFRAAQVVEQEVVG